jgi:hypothetical protein
MFVDFFLLHLDHLIVSDVLTTLVSILSEAPPSAWLPTGGPRVLQLTLSEFDVSPSLVVAFNEVNPLTPADTQISRFWLG